MGKHKKFLKAEKAKVKLKGTKLKEHQNVTKTDFKVRKIVLTEQLKNVQQLESGERKTHNVRDSLSRLGNSASVEAISNLKQIILYQPEDFQKHLEGIIKTVSNLSLSIEKNDRRESFKILDIIFSQTSEAHLRPFFPILVKYLTCAMTHIKPGIQEDSLLMLDLLLKNAPNFVASERDKILTPYLDLVSKHRAEHDIERTLTVQLGNKITNLKWRRSVLERLILFLKCINSHQTKEDNSTKSNQVEEIIVQDGIKCVEFVGNPFANFTTNLHYVSLAALESSKSSTQYEESRNASIMDKYVHTIMPLMFEIWMELLGQDKKASSSVVTQETAVILRSIMDIITELFSMIEGQSSLKLQFLKKYQDSFDKQLIAHFPYLQTGGANSANKKAVQESGGDKCIYQNLSIAIMFFHLSVKNSQRFLKYKEKFFKFTEEAIAEWKSKDPEFNTLMKKLIRTVFSAESRRVFGSDCSGIFNVLIRKCNADQSVYDPKMALVCEIIENSRESKKEQLYDNLLSKMIEALASSDHVPFHLIRTVSVVAKTGNKTLSSTLEQNALEIIKNLQNKMKITGTLTDETEKWRMEIVNLFYWINGKDVLQSIAQYTSNNRENLLSKEIFELVQTKL